jgi:hypothetical protein
MFPPLNIVLKSREAAIDVHLPECCVNQDHLFLGSSRYVRPSTVLPPYTRTSTNPPSHLHFAYIPTAKWALVAAGIKDLSRPADKLSAPQNLALAATGFIWVRYSLVITPVNYSLAAVSTGSRVRIWYWLWYENALGVGTGDRNQLGLRFGFAGTLIMGYFPGGLRSTSLSALPVLDSSTESGSKSFRSFFPAPLLLL